MPIRMNDDQQDQQDQFNDRGGSGGRGGGGFPVGPGGGGGGGLFNLLPLLFSLFRGKGMIFLLVILVGGYFLLNKGGCNLEQIAQLATGGMLDKNEFAKANIYEPLADDETRNPLPEMASLQKFAPTPGDQGQQGSCVAWSSAFGARTIVEAARTGQSPDQIKFSPAFLYNQIGLEGCQGSYIIRAMEFMTKQGSVPYNDFQYTDQDCSRQPDRELLNKAEEFKMRGFNRLSLGDRNDAIDLRAIRENIAQGAPVVIGMMVGPSFMQEMVGKEVWDPAPGDESQMGFGGHAMCVVGYDDKKFGGAFLIMNSWGPSWGQNGFAWVRYPHFQYFVREAYGLEPMAAVGSAQQKTLECEIGLVKVEFDGKKTVAKDYIPLRSAGNNRFETRTPISLDTRFKMEVKNNAECYVYVFGKEVDGTSYTLFPYPNTDDPAKTKYSPFCGITGYRLFPKNKSMQPDSIGNRDLIAVVLSKKPLDWYDLNTKLSRNPGQDFGQRLNALLSAGMVSNLRFSTGTNGTIKFSTDANENEVVACVVEIDK